MLWFLAGLVAFSAMERLQPRYLEAFTPAVCAVFGLSLSVLWRGWMLTAGWGRGAEALRIATRVALSSACSRPR